MELRHRSRTDRIIQSQALRLWFADQRDVQRIRDELKRLGCASEVSDPQRLVAVDTPPDVPYEHVRAFFEKGEQDGMFEYQEACLGQPSP